VTFFLMDNQYFDAVDTLKCGQIFRFVEKENTFLVFSKDKSAKILQCDNAWRVETEYVDYFKNFFDVQTDYSIFANCLMQDSELMKKAVQKGKGIRILRQDLVEMIISFIISANNNIKRIQLIIDRLCSSLGEKIKDGYAFPTIDKLAEQSESFYASIGAGYRAKYLSETSKKLRDDFDLEALVNMDTNSARKALISLMGVGPKVADCILLFGLHRGDVFPVDTWIKKVYHDAFETGLRDDKISTFFVNRFKDLSGLAQQYLFYYYRTIDK